jgi:hypothetical protein
MIQCNSVEFSFIIVLVHSTMTNNNNNIMIIITIPFMQGIHTYIPETNHVSRVHSVAAIPRVLLMVHISLPSILNSFVLLH